MGYLLYARHQGTSMTSRLFSGAIQAYRVTMFWKKLYSFVLHSSEVAWEAVRKGFVAVASRPVRSLLLGSTGKYGTRLEWGDNFIFHNFTRRDEAVRAYVATGELTISGLCMGVRILDDSCGFSVGGADGTSYSIPARFCDGASAAAHETEHGDYFAYFQ